MAEEEYAIVSKKEFLQLKKELEKLKKNPLEGSEKGEDLKDSIDNLSTNLNSMMELFKEAADEMKLEERDREVVGKRLAPIEEKLDTLIEQNQKIAKGLVAVADMVREKLEEIEAKEAEKPEEKKPEMPPGPMPPGPSPGFGGPGFGPMPGAPQGMGGPMPPPGAPPGPPPAPGAPPKRSGLLGGMMR